ncbi:hypothetical protein DUNSADRAFT_8958 [Dunaliella salina]|uniref:Encoded protein n=1 Tax=Dunaliella salina TaxID=3046 RepID=A0ABQ7GII4_DUNSA|nr:hypothetical protein DUNSADRAFT_8958 [Dunaliella salina]|eukprot:KAF5834403.1 hypothetical protein DUNSADRAFT_8958 [Dunaliella salina]
MRNKACILDWIEARHGVSSSSPQPQLPERENNGLKRALRGAETTAEHLQEQAGGRFEPPHPLPGHSPETHLTREDARTLSDAAMKAEKVPNLTGDPAEPSEPRTADHERAMRYIETASDPTYNPILRAKQAATEAMPHPGPPPFLDPEHADPNAPETYVYYEHGQKHVVHHGVDEVVPLHGPARAPPTEQRRTPLSPLANMVKELAKAPEPPPMAPEAAPEKATMPPKGEPFCYSFNRGCPENESLPSPEEEQAQQQSQKEPAIKDQTAPTGRENLMDSTQDPTQGRIERPGIVIGPSQEGGPCLGTISSAEEVADRLRAVSPFEPNSQLIALSPVENPPHHVHRVPSGVIVCSETGWSGPHPAHSAVTDPTRHTSAAIEPALPEHNHPMFGTDPIGGPPAVDVQVATELLSEDRAIAAAAQSAEAAGASATTVPATCDVALAAATYGALGMDDTNLRPMFMEKGVPERPPVADKAPPPPK